MEQKNDELFKNFLDYINNFCIPELIKKDSENFKIALIDITHNIEKMHQTSEERLFDIIVATHKVALKSTITSFIELLSDYNHWLTTNYQLVPLEDEDLPND